MATITLGTGNNTSAPNATKIHVVGDDSNGRATGVVISYSDGTGGVVTSDASGLQVQGTTTLTDMTVTTVNTPISVGDAASSTTLIAANANRKGWTVQNMSTADLYVRLGDPAAIGTCHRVLRQYESMGQRIMDGDLYLGIITGRWASDAGGSAVGGDWE